MENRNGLIVGACTTRATGTAERKAALEPVKGRSCKKSITLGADKGYDSAALVAELRAHNVTPHIAQTPAAGARSMAERLDTKATNRANASTSGSKKRSDGRRHAGTCGKSTSED